MTECVRGCQPLPCRPRSLTIFVEVKRSFLRDLCFRSVIWKCDTGHSLLWLELWAPQTKRTSQVTSCRVFMEKPKCSVWECPAVRATSLWDRKSPRLCHEQNLHWVQSYIEKHKKGPVVLPSHQEPEKEELWSWILHTIWLCRVFRLIKEICHLPVNRK